MVGGGALLYIPESQLEGEKKKHCGGNFGWHQRGERKIKVSPRSPFGGRVKRQKRLGKVKGEKEAKGTLLRARRGGFKKKNPAQPGGGEVRKNRRTWAGNKGRGLFFDQGFSGNECPNKGKKGGPRRKG